MINWLTLTQVVLPLLTGALLYFLRWKKEETISWLALFAVASNSVLWLTTTGIWASEGFKPIDVFFGSLFHLSDYTFDVSFQVDVVTVVFSGLAAFISGIVVKYSQYYLHREPGYKRFFVNILIFLSGINLLAFAGTLDLLFAGWEMVGISSFLLIAFYRNRIEPARHAMRAYSVYRFCDTGLLLGAWLSHLVWHASPTFSDLGSESMLAMLQQAGELRLFGLGLLILLAASGKSAQFPFSFWLPRAMEGPTPSSAIFYGALSVHAGVFLLLRTFPVWHSSYYAPYAVGGLGLLTAILSTLIGHAQSNIKGQIAYASSAQAGVMFVELALGWKDLVLFHMVCNALLRCFQLLVSPSILAFVLRWQGEGGGETRFRRFRWENWVSPRWRATLYVFCLNEGFLEVFTRRILWRPVRWIGEAVEKFASKPAALIPFAVLLAVGLSMSSGTSKDWALGVLVSVSIGLACASLSAFGRPTHAWDMATLAGTLMAGSILLMEHEAMTGVLLVVGSNAVGWILGRYALSRLYKVEPGAKLTEYHGLVERDPLASTLLFVGALFIDGCPIAPGFLGEDLLLHSTVRLGDWSTIVLGVVFVITGLALLRIFVRVSFAGNYRLPARWDWNDTTATPGAA